MGTITSESIPPVRVSGLLQKTWFQVLILVAFCFLLFFVGVGRWDLWDPDEPRYADVAKEMVTTSHDWILMHLNGRIYGDKPPLFFWCIALSSYLWGGFTSFAVRFPPALFATLTVLLTFFTGKRLYSAPTGLLAGLILATCLEFAYLATRGNIDTTLTFFTTASIFSFLVWVQRNREEKNADRAMSGLNFFAFYVPMALATLTKGPVGFIIPLLVSLIYLMVQRDWAGIKKMRLYLGIPLFVAIVLVWYIPAVISGGRAYLMETLFKHTVDAYTTGWTHGQPFYFYFINFPADFLPWTIFFPALILSALSKRKEGIGWEFLFLLVWFVSIFLFFSFSKGKRELYILPLYPAAAVMVGRFWDSYISGSTAGPKIKAWVSLPVYLLAALLFVAAIGLYLIPVVAQFSVHDSPKLAANILKGVQRGATYLGYVPYGSYAPFFFLLPVLGILLFLAQRFRFRAAVFVLVVLTVGTSFFYGTRFIFPEVDPYKSARFLSQEIKQAVKPGERLAMYGGFAVGPYNFYTGIVPILDINNGKELRDFFRSEEKVFCLIQTHEYEAFKKQESGLLSRVVIQRKVGSKNILLVSNQ